MVLTINSDYFLKKTLTDLAVVMVFPERSDPVFKYMLGKSERVHDSVGIVRQKNTVMGPEPRISVVVRVSRKLPEQTRVKF
jgi:hypothetical protein